MSFEERISKEELLDIRQTVERIAQRMGEKTPMPVGFILACEYLGDDGERIWSIRYDPDAGYGTTLGLAKLIELDTERMARQTLGLDERDN